MSEQTLPEQQAPLKKQYQQNPDAAQVTVEAEATTETDIRHCTVETEHATFQTELHEGTGGPGTGPCSGDLLVGALAACTQLTAQAVGSALGIDVDIETAVDSQLDLRGTLGVDRNAPVELYDLTVTVTVNSPRGQAPGLPASTTRFALTASR